MTAVRLAEMVATSYLAAVLVSTFAFVLRLVDERSVFYLFAATLVVATLVRLAIDVRTRRDE